MNPNSRPLFLRLAMGVTFLSAVASRLGLWGNSGGNWQKFLAYTAEVNAFAPPRVIPFLAVAATGLEFLFAVLLIAGFKTRLVALGAGTLTLCFASAMAYSFGPKSPLDYSVCIDSAAMFLLATLPPDRWSVDGRLNRGAQRKMDGNLPPARAATADSRGAV